MAFYPIIDAMEEFRLNINAYSPEYGRSNGGTVMVIGKSGSNQFHGTLFEFFRNEDLNARNYFVQPGPRPEFRRNQYGLTLGGRQPLEGGEDALVQLICRLHATEAAALPGTITQLAIAPAVQERLRGCGLSLRTVEDVFWMWRVIAPARLAAKLGVSEAELDTDDVFHRLLPPERSVYWIADRF